MADNWKQSAIFWVEIIVVFDISVVLFELIVQPFLVSIDPMFAYGNSLLGDGSTRSRIPNTPASVALAATGLICLIAYHVLHSKIGSYLAK